MIKVAIAAETGGFARMFRRDARALPSRRRYARIERRMRLARTFRRRCPGRFRRITGREKHVPVRRVLHVGQPVDDQGLNRINRRDAVDEEPKIFAWGLLLI